MSDRPAPPPGSPARKRRASDPWLVAALVATVVMLFAGWYLYGSVGPAIDTGETFNMGDVTDVDTGQLVVVVARTPGGASEWSNFARVISYLSERIDHPVSVRYVAAEDEAGAIVRAEEADVAFLCAHMYLDLSDAGLVQGVAVPIIADEHECTMQLVVRSEDPVTCFEDLAGSAIAVSDKSSLGGQAYLLWLCDQYGAKVPGYFSEVQTGETMEENITALLEGRVDATIINSAQVSETLATRVRVVAESPPFGLPPVAVAASMDADLRTRIAEALVEFDAQTRLPSTSRLDGFVDIVEVDYEFQQVLREQCGDHGHIR